MEESVDSIEIYQGPSFDTNNVKSNFDSAGILPWIWFSSIKIGKQIWFSHFQADKAVQSKYCFLHDLTLDAKRDILWGQIART